MNFQKVVEGPPRALYLVSRERGAGVPIGRRPVSRRELLRRAEQVTQEVAAGRLPLDEVTAPFVARKMMYEYRRR